MSEKHNDHIALLKSLKKQRKYLSVQFFLSIISLFIAMVVFITSSLAWFSMKTAKLDAANFSLECGKGLRVNDSGTSDFQLKNVTKYILPASSVNGRNLFFPTDGSDFSDKTKEITYRSANVGDKNQNYIQIDFDLTAQANNTALYINEEKTFMKVKTQIQSDSDASTTLAAPLRMAIWSSVTDSDDIPMAPVVFNPTGKTYTTAAVESVDRSSGKITGSTGRQVSHAFSDYAYGGEPVAVLSKGVETHFSVIIWLEGADPKCTYEKMSAKDIIMGLAFTTSWDKTQVVRFKTDETWITDLIGSGSNHHALSLHYKDHDTGEITDFDMYPYNESESEWFCNMPGDMTNEVSFVLTPGKDSVNQNTYEFTKHDANGSSTLDRGVNRLYVAKGSAATNTRQCTGHWVPLGDSDGGGNDSGDIDGDDF